MVIAIIQARMSSTRLPGKVMMDLCGKPVLWHIIKRLGHSKHINKIIVATSIENANNAIREFCSNSSVLYYSGSEYDVLDRFYRTANAFNARKDDLIIRITADCPLIDPYIIDKVIEDHIKKHADYTANVIEPTYPDGLDCEVLNYSVLEKAWENANLKSEREHVTQYIRNHPEIFNIASVRNDLDLSGYRWTLDESEDFEFINIVYNELYKENNIFSTNDVLNLFNKKPELIYINAMHRRNEGLTKSLEKDEIINEH